MSYIKFVVDEFELLISYGVRIQKIVRRGSSSTFCPLSAYVLLLGDKPYNEIWTLICLMLKYLGRRQNSCMQDREEVVCIKNI